MEIGIPRERRALEKRVSVTPLIVKKYKEKGIIVTVETLAGIGAGFRDEDYERSGARIVKDYATVCKTADIIMKVQRPMSQQEGIDELSSLREGTILISNLEAKSHKELIQSLSRGKITSFAMEKIPRISRAQSMDILTSQSNISGYKAVIDAVSVYGRTIPMMMTAAGTIAPAKFLVLGAGVAGLQAIATAKRLGGIVYAFDVRREVKEQVESLGARFLDIEEVFCENKEGYAQEIGEVSKDKERSAIHKQLKQTDIVICTALIPGKKAPILITEEMLRDMRLGSVIMDMAVGNGGNCEGSEEGKRVLKHGVTILGDSNISSSLSYDSSFLLSRNYYNFLELLFDKETNKLKIDLEDEIIKSTCVTLSGQIMDKDML